MPWGRKQCWGINIVETGVVSGCVVPEVEVRDDSLLRPLPFLFASCRVHFGAVQPLIECLRDSHNQAANFSDSPEVSQEEPSQTQSDVG